MENALENAGETSTEVDYLEMSDDDFMKVTSPGAAPVEAEVAEQVQEQAAELPAQTEGEGVAAKTIEADGAAGNEGGVGGEAFAAPEPKTTPLPVVEGAAPVAEKPAAEVAAAEVVAPDYESFYNQMMKPFKANGKTFEPKTTDEAIRLMQMGAGYGRKIQEIQPHLKVLRMLEKNELLDERKLSFLIDINQKNPDAIKKIIKDSGLDPLDLNIEDNVLYNPNDHSVSDKEVEFQEALTDVAKHATGQETIRLIDQTWDKESKAILWDSPKLLDVMQTQRDNGVYDQIVAEIDRQKLFGKIGNSTPFIHAYKIAGDHLQATNGFKFSDEQVQQIQTQPVIAPQTQVIATRTAAPKAQVQNGDKAAAASQTVASTQSKAASTVNPLDMADDVFMKQFNGRF